MSQATTTPTERETGREERERHYTGYDATIASAVRRIGATQRPAATPNATSSAPLDPTERAERRRNKLIADYQAIGIHIDEDTPLEEIAPIDQVTKLRVLATKHRRPISHLDLSDRTVVSRELDRLMMLEGGTRRRGTYKTIRFEPCPANLTAAEKRIRALDAKRARDGRTTAQRMGDAGETETIGYGSHSSYSVQVAEARSMGAEPLMQEATDAQIEYIKNLAAQKRIPVPQMPTRFDLAQELIDQLIAAQAGPTKPMAKYLSDLQRKLGLDQKPAATFDECKAELDRLIALRKAQ